MGVDLVLVLLEGCCLLLRRTTGVFSLDHGNRLVMDQSISLYSCK